MAELPDPSIAAVSRAWYDSSLTAFLNTGTDAIVGRLVRNCTFDVLSTQSHAWRMQIEFLRAHLRGIDGWLFFEFNIPRMGRRIDAVVLAGPAIFVIEFKVGASEFDRSALEQVWDYGLDLKNFHEASHNRPVIPILIATEARHSPGGPPVADSDGVFRPIAVTPADFRTAVDRLLSLVEGPSIDPQRWLHASYRPTPTIVEAARALYAQHSVESIARSDAGAKNLAVTSQRVEEIIAEARRSRQKVICFVTGVPGAGKTLVGLNVATHRRDQDVVAPAVYLSGNGPLVAVLREALTRDEVMRQKLEGRKVRKAQVAESVKAFIQNVHHFRDEALSDKHPPVEHVAVFDEAQRAWTQRQTANFMRRKKNVADFEHSEPEFLISYMDRHSDWGVVVCLVGGGQEINIGEAGIDAWLDAVSSKFPDWQMHISSKLTDSEYAAGRALEAARRHSATHFDDALHLAVSMRSFRAENVSEFVKALLDREVTTARNIFERLSDRYPIAVTRDLDAAREWVRDRARGSERFGLLASSRAHRLKPHAIDVRVDVDPVSWFLNGRDDTRSSYFLEDAATEFQVQGLELDWSCVTWDADLRSNSSWSYHDFRGNRWLNVANADNRRYLLNAYRVLLTRARQGMVIFVPPGSARDQTRPPEYYDPIFRYLRDAGLPVLEAS